MIARRRPMLSLYLTLGALALALPVDASAQAPRGGEQPLSTRASFPIGSEGVRCSAQLRLADPAASGTFDRAYAVTCEDAAAAVGQLYALRGITTGALLARRSDLDCRPFAPAGAGGIPGAEVAECTRRSDGLPYRVHALSRGKTLFVAQGLRGYDSANLLGLRALAADRVIGGKVEVAVTEAGDPTAFARVQAGELDPQSALGEAYARNNAGEFADAAAFFDTLAQSSSAGDAARSTEYLLNQALQQSNLGNFRAADPLFAEAERRGAADGVVLARLLRNYRALDQLNRHAPDAALVALARPVPHADAVQDSALAAGSISDELAASINRANAGFDRSPGGGLTPAERAQILDGQAALLQGAALRLKGDAAGASRAFDAAHRIIAGVRGGQVQSATFLEADILAQQGLAHEAAGRAGDAEAALRSGVALLQRSYPDSSAVLTAKARLAGLLARRGNIDAALALYGEIVAEAARQSRPNPAMPALLRPYFAMLAKRGGDDPATAGAMFAAAQLLVRPGLAQTQAVLARELSSGDDDAARLFRSALNRGREIAATEAQIAQLDVMRPKPGSTEAAALDTARTRVATLRAEQVALQAQLSAYPRYNAVVSASLSAAELQQALRPGEAYYELRTLGPDAYAVLLTPDSARAVRVDASTVDLAEAVAKLRASIVRTEGGQYVTEPFDVHRARKLYSVLFGPFEATLRGVQHLIYEPDGPLLELPPTLLVADDTGLAAYDARAARADGDPFDFTGIAWLGRSHDVTTAVSPRAFVEVRKAAASRAARAYLGFGQNARPPLAPSFLATAPGRMPETCSWPAATWNNPISPAELNAARDFLGDARARVVTGAEFTDTAIDTSGDLADYRVLHFATHGLVTAPRAECPARPALVTSFGDAKSDGLLSFAEIFDLHLDADIVLLSGCDTAGVASAAATREAGVQTGGDYALDGLVRAFVGAGARAVVASHWPVPDDYEATKRLTVGMLRAPPGTPLAGALRQAETALMDDPATSHPFYWAAFAVIGDGARAALVP